MWVQLNHCNISGCKRLREKLERDSRETRDYRHMEKQEMEVEWKLETENGNGNWKRKYKSGWSLSCPNRFACCCWLVVHMHPELSQPPVYLASFGVGTSNAALGSSLASFPGSSENYPSATSLMPRPSRT